MQKEYFVKEKKCPILFLFFLHLVSFWALVKYIVLHFLFKLDTKKIRGKFYGSLWVDRFSSFNRGIRLNATNWKALDSLYNYQEKMKGCGLVERFFSGFWTNMENFHAINNRAEKVTMIIKKELQKNFNRQEVGEINVLSIASGSAQPLLEAIRSFSSKQQQRINLTLLDLDKSALDNSKALFAEFKIKSNLKTIKDSAHNLEKLFNKRNFDIIEMVGFLDYRPKLRAICLIKKIKKLMKKQGIFLTCNIYPNKEKYFLDWVLLWPMIYRKKEFKEILLKSGFKDKNIKIIFTQFTIHQLAICYNRNK
ncbi:MAG: methyltransferase domain-containing protein [Patescibacteria group bacterium]|nr:methyltransferase domain-containing protein [Patescibacteria group bacterium]